MLFISVDKTYTTCLLTLKETPSNMSSKLSLYV